MLLMCAIIKLTSPGPLIYKQERVGLHNQTFRMYKFRSMEVQPEFSRLQISVSEDAKLSVNDLAALPPFADFIENEAE